MRNWLYRLIVRTEASQASNLGAIPSRVTNENHAQKTRSPVLGAGMCKCAFLHPGIIGRMENNDLAFVGRTETKSVSPTLLIRIRTYVVSGVDVKVNQLFKLTTHYVLRRNRTKILPLSLELNMFGKSYFSLKFAVRTNFNFPHVAQKKARLFWKNNFYCSAF